MSGEATSPFEFQREHDGSLDLQTAVFQALGAASMAWSESPRGVFESEWAKAIGDALLAFIGAQEQALLGLATTRELLAELTSRIELDWYVGGGGLDYSTVKGRPDPVVS